MLKFRNIRAGTIFKQKGPSCKKKIDKASDETINKTHADYKQHEFKDTMKAMSF